MAANVQYKRPEPYESQVVVVRSRTGPARARAQGARQNVRGGGCRSSPHTPGIYLSRHDARLGLPDRAKRLRDRAPLGGRRLGGDHRRDRRRRAAAHVPQRHYRDLRTGRPHGACGLAPAFSSSRSSPRRAMRGRTSRSSSSARSGNLGRHVESLACFEMPRACSRSTASTGRRPRDGALGPGHLRRGERVTRRGRGVALKQLGTPHLFAQSFPRLRSTRELDRPLHARADGCPAQDRPGRHQLVCRWDVRVRAGDRSTGGEVRITSGVDGNTDTLTLAVGAVGRLAPGGLDHAPLRGRRHHRRARDRARGRRSRSPSGGPPGPRRSRHRDRGVGRGSSPSDPHHPKRSDPPDEGGAIRVLR